MVNFMRILLLPIIIFIAIRWYIHLLLLWLSYISLVIFLIIESFVVSYLLMIIYAVVIFSMLFNYVSNLLLHRISLLMLRLFHHLYRWTISHYHNLFLIILTVVIMVIIWLIRMIIILHLLVNVCIIGIFAIMIWTTSPPIG